jgi:hypothetical protein
VQGVVSLGATDRVTVVALGVISQKASDPFEFQGPANQHVLLHDADTGKVTLRGPAPRIVRQTAAGVTLNAMSADRGDNSVTLTVMSSAETQLFATTLTANRTITLSAAGAVNGDKFRIVRTGLGAFTLAVGAVKTIPSGTAAFVDIEYDGSAWFLTGYGVL